MRPDELETLLPAAVAMFTEEVGVSPLRVDGGAGYRARVAELVRAGQSLAWIEDGEVLFKAEIGAVPGPPARCRACGWRPRTAAGASGRGHGGRRRVRPDGDRPRGQPLRQRLQRPRAGAYRRVGFREVGQYASVLF